MRERYLPRTYRKAACRLSLAQAQEIRANRGAFEGTDLLEAADRRADEEGILLGSGFFERSRKQQALQQISDAERDIAASTERERQIGDNISKLQIEVEQVVDDHWRRIIAMLERVLEIGDQQGEEEVVAQRNRDNSGVANQ